MTYEKAAFLIPLQTMTFFDIPWRENQACGGIPPYLATQVIRRFPNQIQPWVSDTGITCRATPAGIQVTSAEADPLFHFTMAGSVMECAATPAEQRTQIACPVRRAVEAVWRGLNDGENLVLD